MTSNGVRASVYNRVWAHVWDRVYINVECAARQSVAAHSWYRAWGGVGDRVQTDMWYSLQRPLSVSIRSNTKKEREHDNTV